MKISSFLKSWLNYSFEAWHCNLYTNKITQPFFILLDWGLSISAFCINVRWGWGWGSPIPTYHGLSTLTHWQLLLSSRIFHCRLLAELEEAREEARIKAQEEIVIRIQEAKVRNYYRIIKLITRNPCLLIRISSLCLIPSRKYWERNLSHKDIVFLMSLLVFLFVHRMPPNKNWMNKNSNMKKKSHIYMKLWY